METIGKERVMEVLEKYFEATASLEEEKLLRDYFKKGADPGLEMYAPLFNCFSEEIEALELPSTPVISRPGKYVFRWVSLGAAAALLIFTFVLQLNRGDSLRLFIDGNNVNDKELALSLASDQLQQVNALLGKYKGGSKKLENLNKAGSAISPLGNIEKFLKQNHGEGRLND